ncbi:hypothetical protein RQP46_001885 [Phenoliferia psychrophenolica]
MPLSFAVLGSRIRDTVDMLLCSWFPLYSDLEVTAIDLTGKNVIITGANVGIGLESARKLASYNATVTLACRNAEKGEKARQELILATGNDKIEVRILDTASFASVRAFVDEWGEKPVDILINNAGVTPTKYYKTKDDIEESFQTNFMSHFLLTSLLLPFFQPNGRIIQVSSVANYGGTLDPLDVSRIDYLERELGEKEGAFLKPNVFIGLYADAKLAQISSIWERHKGETPGGDLSIKRLMSVISRFGITIEQGSCVQTWLATDPVHADKGGLYYNRYHASAPNALVEDAGLRTQMWNAWSEKCGVSADL